MTGTQMKILAPYSSVGIPPLSECLIPVAVVPTKCRFKIGESRHGRSYSANSFLAMCYSAARKFLTAARSYVPPPLR